MYAHLQDKLHLHMCGPLFREICTKGKCTIMAVNEGPVHEPKVPSFVCNFSIRAVCAAGMEQYQYQDSKSKLLISWLSKSVHVVQFLPETLLRAER
jgi:hypothetical protein